MRHAVLIAALLLGGCGSYHAVQKAEKAYTDCLDAKPMDQCQAERSAYEAAVARNNSRPPMPQQPLILQKWTPPPPVYTPNTSSPYTVTMPNGQRMNCKDWGNGNIQCY